MIINLKYNLYTKKIIYYDFNYNMVQTFKNSLKTYNVKVKILKWCVLFVKMIRQIKQHLMPLSVGPSSMRLPQSHGDGGSGATRPCRSWPKEKKIK